MDSTGSISARSATQDLKQLLKAVKEEMEQTERTAESMSRVLYGRVAGVEHGLAELKEQIGTLFETAKASNSSLQERLMEAIELERRPVQSPTASETISIESPEPESVGSARLVPKKRKQRSLFAESELETQPASPEPRNSATSSPQVSRSESHSASSTVPSETSAATSSPVLADGDDVGSREIPRDHFPDLFVTSNRSDPRGANWTPPTPKSDGDRTISIPPSETNTAPSTPEPAAGHNAFSGEAHGDEPPGSSVRDNSEEERPTGGKGWEYAQPADPVVRHYGKNFKAEAKKIPWGEFHSILRKKPTVAYSTGSETEDEDNDRDKDFKND